MAKRVTVPKDLRKILAEQVTIDKKAPWRYIVAADKKQAECDELLMRWVSAIETFAIRYNGYVAVLDHGYKIPFTFVENGPDAAARKYIKSQGNNRQIIIEMECDDDAAKAFTAVIAKAQGGTKNDRH